MDNSNITDVESRAMALCEEFCRYVVLDTGNLSILVNVEHEFYFPLSIRLKNLGYREVFKACVHPRNTVTSTFIYVP